jgi:hypothetical protein
MFLSKPHLPLQANPFPKPQRTIVEHSHALLGKPDAGKPHIRFEEGKRRSSMLSLSYATLSIAQLLEPRSTAVGQLTTDTT